MSKPTFKIIYNLDGLDDAAIARYMEDVSAYFGLEPGINWFDALWMTDPDTGLRRKQLYARRGTTDILRDRRKISVDEMVQHDGPGYVSFTAKGKDASGRTEIAVGAHSTEGLKGEKLAAAVSTAETRAGRRLTLKFCGLGILDYTEVTDPVDVKASPAELTAVAPAPIFSPSMPTPNAAPGKMVDPKERAASDSAAQALAEANEISRKALEAAGQHVSVAIPYDAQATLSDPKATEEAQAAAHASTVVAPDPVHAPRAVLRSDGLSIPVPPGASTVVDNTPLPAEVPAAPKQRRTRKKNTVDISAPGQVSAPVETPASPICLDCKQPLSDHGLVNSERVCGKPFSPEQATRVAIDPLVHQAAKELAYVPPQVNPVVPPQVDSAVPSLAPVVTAVPHPAHMTMTLPTPPVPHQPILAPPTPAPPTNFPGQPSKEQETQYREKLREYSNVILPGAGMVPSPGIGGPSAKLRMYAERMAGKLTQQMTTDDWDDFFNGMADFRNRNGDKGLVKYINDVIGAK